MEKVSFNLSYVIDTFIKHMYVAGALGSNLGWRYQKPLPYRLAMPQLKN